MKTFYFQIKRTRDSAFEHVAVDAIDAMTAVSLLPDCVTWDFRTDNGRSMTREALGNDRQRIKTRLRDVESPGGGDPEVVIDISDTMIELSVEGYGCAGASFGKEPYPGAASLVGLELCQGRLRLLVWPDINDEQPTLLDLSETAEDRRKVSDSEEE